MFETGRRLLWAASGALLLALAGCSGGGMVPATPPQVQVSVSGSSQVRVGATVQLTATVTNSTSTAVTWQVNGVDGGAAATGTITTTGLYTPPATIPSGGTVTIAAVTQTTPAFQGTITEAILNPMPVVSAATATATSVGGTSYTVDVQGSGFINGSTIQVGGQTLTTTFVSSTELQATYTGAAGQTGSIAVTVANPNPGAVTSSSVNAQFQQLLATQTAAARLLDQSSFGPTASSIAHVQLLGLSAALQEQFSQPATMLPDIPSPDPTQCTNNTSLCAESEWWQNILTGNDQLRQRVAFALSEIFVTSTDNPGSGRPMTPYMNVLVNDAFTNYRTIMEDVALSISMGEYLNMLNSDKPPTGQIANENFARELMQLFTTGIDVLNPDGTLPLDGSGNPIPVYTQAQVQAFARAYTGWTWANADGTAPNKFPNSGGAYGYPMMAVETHHDMTAKTILNGVTLPAGQSAEQDLKGALDNIFNHPNVGPFVCRQLIQHLVKGNPSPAYVQRVAAVFANNGSGVRGDMKAVITAILMDSEARAADMDPTVDGGHLREPILYEANVVRALGFTSTNTDPTNLWPYMSLSGYSTNLSEHPLRSNSVFNFFPPSYVIPSTLLPGTNITSPEFALENTASAMLRLSLADQLSQGRLSGFTAKVSATSPLGMVAATANTGPGDLVDTLNALFLHGQMSTQMRTAIVSAITPLTDNGQRVRVAVYLVLSSSQYKILN